MNGFASGLHVKGATAKRVQQAVTDLLSDEGFQVQSAEQADPAEAEQNITRGVWVAQAKGDWVSVFCSDFMFQQEIGRELSKRLKTHALNVWVTEGSSWHYSLFHNGEEVDQFDSNGDEDELQDFLDDDMDELNDELDSEADGDLAAVADEDEEDGPIAEGFSRLAELQQNLAGQMPEDVRAIYDRLTEGKASLGDMRRFDQWSQANQRQLEEFQDRLQQQTADLMAKMQGAFQQNGAADQGEMDPAKMLGGILPPDIAEMFGKMISGQATPEEMQRFAEGLEDEEDDEFDDELENLGEDDDVEEAVFSAEDDDDDDLFADEDQSAISEEQLQVHLGALRPLLVKNVDPEELADTLTTQDDSPEEPLGEFLNLLGIEESLAAVDFESLEQATAEELEDQGITLSPLLLVRST